MITLKKKKKVTYTLGGQTFSFAMRRPIYDEGPEIRLAILESLEPLQSLYRRDTEGHVIETTQIEKARAVAAAVKALPRPLVERLFQDYVCDVEGLEDEDGCIESGARLFQVADANLVHFVAIEFQALSTLTVEEGKGSASLSTSDSVPEEIASASPAPIIESEAGPTVSTATPTPEAP